MARFLLVFFTIPFMLWGCGSEDSSNTLSVSPTNIEFTAAPGEAAPAPATVKITGSGYVGVEYSGDDFVSYTLNAAGSNSMNLVVTPVDPDVLGLGSYKEYLRVYICEDYWCDSGEVASKTVVLTYVVGMQPGSITLGASSLTYEYVEGAAPPAAQYVSIGGAEGSWSASVNQSWVSLSATSGTVPATLGVTLDLTGLSAGQHSATVTVTGSDGNPKNITVTLNIQAPAFLLDKTSLNFSGINGTAIGTQSVNIQINNGAEATWTASSNAGWLIPDAMSGITPGVLTLNVDPSVGPISGGSYDALVTLETTVNGNTVSEQIAVSLELTPAAFTPSQTSLSFAGINGAVIEAQAVNVQLNSGLETNFSANSDSGWLILDSTSGTTPGVLSFTVDPSIGPISGGTYQALVTLDTVVNGTPVSGEIPVTLELTPAAFTLSQTALSFAGVNGADIATQTLDIALNNGMPTEWSGGSNAAWLIPDILNGATTSTMTLEVDPSFGPLASGTHTATVTLNAIVNGSPVTVEIPVTLGLTKASLSLEPATLTLGGTNGLDFSAQTLDVSLNTGGNAYSWSAQLDTGTAPEWLLADATIGTVSETPQTLTIDANRNGMVGGNHTGQMVFSTQINGDTVTATLPVELNLSAHHLVVSDNGVAFTSLPARQKLVQTISLSDTYDLTDTPWSASSDQSWLTVDAASGTVADTLTLTADPTGLTTDQLYLATVTLTSSDSAIENAPTIRIGLWVGASDPVDLQQITVNKTELAADPIRPYVYSHSGGTDVTVYNIYTGAEVTTLNGVAAKAGDMEVASDGSFLYTVDENDPNIKVTNLETFAWDKNIPLGSLYLPFRIAYARPAGHPVLFARDGNSYDALTGADIGGSGGSQVFAVSADSTQLCGVNTGVGPQTLRCNDVAYSSMNFGEVMLSRSTTASVQGYGKDVAISPDGKTVYVPSTANGYGLAVYDRNDILQYRTFWTEAAYPNNVEVLSNGDVLGGLFSWYGPNDVWYFSDTGSLVSNHYLSGYATAIHDRQLVVSGDELSAVALTDAGVMSIQALP